MVNAACVQPYVWGTMLPSSVWPFDLKSVKGLITFRARSSRDMHDQEAK